MIVLIGSRAAQFHHPEHWKQCNDYDLIATLDDFTNWFDQHKDNVKSCFPFDKGKKFYVKLNDDSIMEWEIAHKGSTGENFLVLSAESWQFSTLYGTKVAIPSMDWLFTLKASHKYLKNSPHFEKTMRDYHLMKYTLGCKVTDKSWFKDRETVTYTYAHPKLNQSKGDFFSNDGLEYVYDHDSIHKAIAKFGFNDRPAYTYYMMDDEDVMCDKKKWDALPNEMKLRGALEEALVLALERSQIPYRDEIDPKDSFKIALMKTCSSITSGWFRRFSYLNYYKILDMYTDDYVNWFDKGLENNIVKPFKE